MLELVNKSVRGLETTKKNIQTSGTVFKFTTKYSACLLMLLATFSTCKTYFGEPMVCSLSGNSLRVEVAETFCWSFGTFIDLNLMNHTVGNSIAHYGVGPVYNGTQSRLYQRYYQWVAPMLGIQALLFFLPKILWQIMEKGRMSQLCNEIKEPYLSEDWKTKHILCLSSYILEMPLSQHCSYAFKYFLCEIVSLLSLLFNVFLVQFMFTGFWFEFGPAVLSFAFEDWQVWSRFATKLFPKIAKCEFFKIGFSGSIEKHDILCMLPLNIINEKIFALLYFWYILLMMLLGFNIVYRILSYGRSKWRVQTLHRKFPLVSIKTLRRITRDGKLGLCFLIDALGQNVTYRQMVDLLNHMDDDEVLNKYQESMY